MQSEINSVNDLQLKESEDITLYSVKGRVISVKEFAEQHANLLSGIEREMIMEMKNALSSESPSELEHPLVRTSKYADGLQQTPAKRCGTRSAYMPELGLKIKGCRPEEARFPHWELSEDFSVKVNWLPFGVLDAEGVMREILANCFTKKYGLPYSNEPAAVFEYKPNNKFVGYGLAIKTAHDARAEEFIDCQNYTLHSLVRKAKNPNTREALGGEAGLKGMDFTKYVEKKTDLLIAFNFNGGFRGVLNSNIGNDVIRESELHSLCDFDSFIATRVPSSDEKNGIRKFIIRSFIELVKTSLPFIDYIEFDSQTKEEIHSMLSEYYREKSSVYKKYKQKFLAMAKEKGWNEEFVEECINGAFGTPITFELLQELVPNSFTLKTFKNESYYVPHR